MQQNNGIQRVMSMGDVRQLLIETALNIRDGSLSQGQGAGVVACMEALTKTMQVEINSAKLAMATTGSMHEFGKVVKLGTTFVRDQAGIE